MMASYRSVIMLIVLSNAIIGGKEGKENPTLYEADNGFLCQKCKKGYYLLKACDTDHGPSTCQACPKNTFMDKANRYQECAECRICHGGQETITECSSVSNRVCQCPTGKYWIRIPGNDGWCDFHSVCKHGSVVLTPGTPWKDTVCGDKDIISTSTATYKTTEDLDQNPHITTVPTKGPTENPPQDNDTDRGGVVFWVLLVIVVVCFFAAWIYCRHESPTVLPPPAFV